MRLAKGSGWMWQCLWCAAPTCPLSAYSIVLGISLGRSVQFLILDRHVGQQVEDVVVSGEKDLPLHGSLKTEFGEK